MGIIESEWLRVAHRWSPKWLVYLNHTCHRNHGEGFWEHYSSLIADDADKDGIICGSLKYIMFRVQVKPKLPEARTAHNLSDKCWDSNTMLELWDEAIRDAQFWGCTQTFGGGGRVDGGHWTIPVQFSEIASWLLPRHAEQPENIMRN